MPGDILTDQAIVANETPPSDESYSDYSFAKQRIDKVINGWDGISKETDKVRALRHLKVDRDSLTQEKKLRADETYICRRLIDSNIRAEQPQHVAYLTQSRRSAVFKPKNLQAQLPAPVDILEENFTLVSRYTGWEVPLLAVDDGASGGGRHRDERWA